MSTIIRRLARAGAAAGTVAGLWSMVMVALPFLGAPGRQVAVVGNRAASVRAILAAGGSVIEPRGRAVLARSDRPGFAAALYREGAALVLEGRAAGGCLGAQSAR